MMVIIKSCPGSDYKHPVIHPEPLSATEQQRVSQQPFLSPTFYIVMFREIMSGVMSRFDSSHAQCSRSCSAVNMSSPSVVALRDSG